MSVPKTQRGEGQLVVITKAEELAEYTVKIRPERISHERRKLRKLVQKAKNGYMTREQVDACYQSWKAHASYGDTHNLILQMDKFYKELWR